MGFASDIDKWCNKALVQTDKNLCKAVEGLFSEVVTLSPNSPTRTGPYSTGVVKGNWYAAVGGTNSTTTSSADPSGASSYSRIKATLATKPFLGKDALVTLTNSTPYIQFVENIGWPKHYMNASMWQWSGKAGPYAMVKTAVTNFKGAYL